MTDYFAQLDLPRSPWLDPTVVQQQFARLSGPVHPDRVHQADAAARAVATQRYAQLNAARQCLVNPCLRLRHLIELETGRPPGDVGAVPPHISEMFFTVGKALRKADELVRTKQAATSPMTQALAMRQVMDELPPLREAIQELEQRRAGLDERCQALGGNGGTTGGWFTALVELHRDYSYVSRWIDQLRERQLQLTL